LKIRLRASKPDSPLPLPTVTIAEIAFGIQKIRPDQRAERLERGLSDWRRRFADRIFGLTEEAALAYGDIMGEATRRRQPMSAPDGMIAAIAALTAADWPREISMILRRQGSS
jgi:predicted nucleic acid-binding protein